MNKQEYDETIKLINDVDASQIAPTIKMRVKEALSGLADHQWADYLGSIDNVEEYEEAYGVKEYVAEGIQVLTDILGRDPQITKYIDWDPETGDNSLRVSWITNDWKEDDYKDNKFHYDWLDKQRGKPGRRSVYFSMGIGPNHVKYPPEPSKPVDYSKWNELDYSTPIDTELLRAFGALDNQVS